MAQTVEEWIACPTLTSGKMDDILWELATCNIKFKEPLQRLGALLKAAGWTRQVLHSGRIWYAPGVKPIDKRSHQAIAIQALRDHLAANQVTTYPAAKAAISDALGYHNDAIIGRAIKQLGDNDEIIRGPVNDGPNRVMKLRQPKV